MDFAAIMMAAKAAVSAAQGFQALYTNIKGMLSPEQEAQLKPELDKLRQANDELYAEVDAKLAAAAKQE